MSTQNELRLRRGNSEVPNYVQTANVVPPDERRAPPPPAPAEPSAAALWLLVICFYAAVFASVNYAHWHVPEPFTPPVSAHPPPKFIASEAFRHASALAGLGVRDVGSRANEVQAPEVILNHLNALQKAAPEVNAKLEIDRQVVSGSFGLEFLANFTSVYSNVTNILAKLSWPGISASHAVLVSAHYDSAWCSEGASDDLVQVGTAMEMLRALMAGPPLPVSVVFNFNGAEETILQASHGFITQHAWAQDCRVAVNLEASGVGGRELLFQTGPSNPWLTAAYLRAAPYPHLGVFAQELFQSGAIPGETDYRIYRDFGHIPGFDSAFIMDGWAYHTDRDCIARLKPNLGSIQRNGDNWVAVVREVAAAPEISPSHPNLTRAGPLDMGGAGPVWTVPAMDRNKEADVFFDMLGMFTFSYSKSFALLMHLGVAALASLLWQLPPRPPGERVTRARVKRAEALRSAGVFRALSLAGASWLAALLAATFTGALLTWVLQSPLSWYARPELLLPLFGGSSLAASTAVHIWGSKNVKVFRDDMFLAGLGSAEVVLLIATLMDSGTGYLPLSLVVGYLGAAVFPNLLPNSDQFLRPLIFLFFFSPAIILHTGLFLEFFLFLTPLMGRSGTILPPDIVIGPALAAILVVIFYPAMLLLHYTAAPPEYLWTASKQLNNTTAASSSHSTSPPADVGLTPQDQEGLKGHPPPPQPQGEGAGGKKSAPSRSWLPVVGLAAILLVGLAVAITAPTYTKDRPKRIKIQHTVRKVHNSEGEVIAEDSGLWVNGMDFIHPLPILQAALAPHSSQSQGTPPVSLEGVRVENNVGGEYPFLDSQGQVIDIGPSLLSNLPWVIPIHNLLGKHVYIPKVVTPSPSASPVRVTLLHSSILNDTSAANEEGSQHRGAKQPSVLSPFGLASETTRFEPKPARRKLRLLIEGADHMSLLFEAGSLESPSISWWSLTDNTPTPLPPLGASQSSSSSVHYVLYATGGDHLQKRSEEKAHPRKGHLEVEVEMSDATRPLTFVVISNEKERVTEAAAFLIRALPEWVASCAWTSYWNRYTF